MGTSMPPDAKKITRPPDGSEQREAHPAEELLPLVYEELRKVAAARMAMLPAGQTLQPTALVHEAYLKLVRGKSMQWADREHFVAAAARAMRHILVDRARYKKRERHGGELIRADKDVAEIALPVGIDPETLLSLNEALDELRRMDEAKAQVVELKFFLGLTNEEVASTMQVSTRTVERHWAYAKAWLFERVTRDP